MYLMISVIDTYLFCLYKSVIPHHAAAMEGWLVHRDTEVGMALDKDEVFEKIKGILIRQLGVEADEVTREASFQGTLAADSLDLVELIMELEDTFGVKIPDEDAENIGTVQQAIDYIMKHQ
jgi:acyl carrier protein